MDIKKETRTVFITEDGKEHLTLTTAEEHNRRLIIFDLMDKHGVCRGGNWDQSMIYAWMMEVREELGTALVPELLYDGS